MAKVTKHPYAGKSGYERDFIKVIHEMTYSGRRRHANVLEDFLEMAYCAVAKSTLLPGSEADALEERYRRVEQRNEAEYIRRMPELLALFSLAHGQEHGDGDFLGRVAGELGALNEGAGQFFTPFEVSKLMAKINLTGVGEVIERQGFVTISEPASGAGGMLLAAAEALEEEGFDPHIHMWAQAIDVSATSYRMTYLQLAARGIPADVIHGNALSLEQWDSAITPAKIPFVLHQGPRWVEWCRTLASPGRPPEEAETVIDSKPTAITHIPARPAKHRPLAAQMSLF